MSNIVITPNMHLTVPVAGQEPGPNYANDVNTSLTLVDSHDHSATKGIQITPDGLNINKTLNVQSNIISNIASLTMITNSGSPGAQSIYVALAGSAPIINELFYNDGANPPVQITKNGIVNVVASSIPGESYAAGTFTWTQTQDALPTTPANFAIGSVKLQPNVASTPYSVTLMPSSSIASAYNISLPLLPSSTSILTMDTSGTITASIPVSGGIPASAISPTAGLNPTGAIIMYGGVAAPTGYALCNGAAISRSTFSALFSAIGTTFGAGDGSTTFNVPDMRGIFARGAGGSQVIGGVTYSGALATKENDHFPAHNHAIYGPSSGGTPSEPQAPGANGFAAVTQTGNEAYIGSTPATGTPYVQATGVGTETQPANIGLTYIIKT